jgi:hypothetical protein
LCGILDEESARNGGVGVETYFELVEEREQVFFDVSGHSVVVSLEDGGEDRSGGGLDIVNLLNVGGFEVGEAELVESLLAIARKWGSRRRNLYPLKLPSRIQFLNSCKRIFDWRGWVGSMEVININLDTESVSLEGPRVS